MAKVVWTTSAVDDLEQIGKFIERDSPRYAQVVVSRLYNAVGRLRRFPLSGRKVPETSETNLREIISDDYRIIYRLEGRGAFILTIVHGSWELLKHFES